MIKCEGKCVAVLGEKEEIFSELVYLHIAIMKNPDLMEMDLKAMDAAVDLVQNNEVKATVIDGKGAIEEQNRSIKERMEELIRKINEGAEK